MGCSSCVWGILAAMDDFGNVTPKVSMAAARRRVIARGPAAGTVQQFPARGGALLPPTGFML
jgi:hypothetical protein